MPFSVLPNEYKEILKVPRKYSKKKSLPQDDEFYSFIPGKNFEPYPTDSLLFFNFDFSFKVYFGLTTFEMLSKK